MAKKKSKKDTEEDSDDNVEEVPEEKSSVEEKEDLDNVEAAASENVKNTEPSEQDESKKDEKKKKRTDPKIKLFNRWSFDTLEVHDDSLVKYINLEPIIIPHSGGKHEHKRFWKTEHVSVIERFINKMMSPGLIRRKIKGRGSAWNAGKKQKIMKILENAFAIVEQKTGNNPLQSLIDAICNAAPREETTRISLGGISYQTAVDIAPQRRVDLGIRLLVQSSVGQTYNSPKTIDECIANEIIFAAREDQSSRAIKRKDELERIAMSAR